MALSPDEIARAVEMMQQDARAWNDERSKDRIQAIEYYDGIMRDTPSDDGRSKMVSRDFRAATKKVLPAIVRTILGGERVVEYMPVGIGDDDMADQATDYVNEIVMLECNGHAVIHDAIHDALRVANGIIKWWWDESTIVKTMRYSGLSQDEFQQLAQSDSVQVMEYSQAPDGMISCKLKRTDSAGRVGLACIPAEEFFLDRDCRRIEDAVFCAHNQKLRRWHLVAMGYDKAKVWELPAYTSRSTRQDAEEMTRREDTGMTRGKNDLRHELDEIDYWECFVRIDADGDGYAEMRRIVFAGGWQADKILDDDDIDEAPFADVVIERRPHEWLGRSLFDDVHEVQRVKTVLLRSTLDNLYWQNNLQPIHQDGAVLNPESVNNPAFGQPIRVQQGSDVNNVVGFAKVPFVAGSSFEMLGYFDSVLKDRTGISDASGGLPSDALQNVTATASALFEQSSISQTELMVRSISEGLRRMFRGILKTVIEHQDKPRTVRLRDKWVSYDPRSWNADMDASVNVGLGAGTRERDMMAMQIVNQTQEKLIAGFGPDNPFVTPDNLYNSIAKLYEAAGLKNVGLYLTKPDPQVVQQMLQAKAAKPSPEQMKAQTEQMKAQSQAQTQVITKHAELQAHVATEQAKAQGQAQTANVKMWADLATQDAQMQHQKELEDQKAANQMALERMRMDRQHEFRQQMQQQRALDHMAAGSKL